MPVVEMPIPIKFWIHASPTRRKVTKTDCFLIDTYLLTPDDFTAELAQQRCSILKSVVFEKCHPFVSPQEAETMCRHDVCQCNKGAACYCNVIAHYARLCAMNGQVIDWRTEEICRKMIQYSNNHRLAAAVKVTISFHNTQI